VDARENKRTIVPCDLCELSWVEVFGDKVNRRQEVECLITYQKQTEVVLYRVYLDVVHDDELVEMSLNGFEL